MLSSDSETFTVAKKVADMSNTIKDIVDGDTSVLTYSCSSGSCDSDLNLSHE